MKILFLFPHFISPGGAANVVLQFARALQLKGHKVEILCARVSKEFRCNNPELMFREIKVPLSNSIFYWLFLPFWQIIINKELKSYQGYILFPHVLPSSWWAWMYKRKNKGAKIVWYCHEPSAFIHSPIWINAIHGKFMKWGAKLLNPFLKVADVALEKANNVVICNSNFTKESYEKVYKRKADLVLYPPCQIITIQPEKNKENYILAVCRLSKFKNIDLLIKAFKIISANFSDCKLVIAGDGEEREQLKKLANHLGLESRISFLGNKNQEELADFYQKARVTVMSSRDETFGLVPVESMMCGTPVIAHNSGGPKETILDGETGFFYNNETELVQSIKKVFEMDKDQYFRMQQKCLKESTKYDISNSILQLESIFRSLHNSNFS